MKTPHVTNVDEAPPYKLLGMEWRALLPREQSEAMEVLWERFPKGLSFPVHQHKECEQFYFVLKGEVEVTVGDQVHRLKAGSVVYIPRHTPHGVHNVGEGELEYVVFETYPDGYLPEEPTWESHYQALVQRYGGDTK